MIYSKIVNRAFAMTIALVCLIFAGCGSSQPQVTEDQAVDLRLNEVAEIYRVYSVTFKKPPKSSSELVKVENVAPSGMTPITSGQIEVFWGGELTDLGEEPSGPESDKILAFEKDVPTKGGKVLMLDRRIKTLTAEQFQSAPKAGTLESAASKSK